MKKERRKERQEEDEHGTFLSQELSFLPSRRKVEEDKKENLLTRSFLRCVCLAS